MAHTRARRFMPLYLMAIPGLLYLFINNYLPLFGIVIAFKNLDYTKGILGSPWAGLQNFEFLFRTSDAFVITRNTILYNVVFIALNFCLAIVLAIMFNELRSRFKSRFYQSVILLPHLISTVIIGYLVLSLLSSEWGLMNKSVLPLLGIKEIDWYSDPKFWPYILTIVSVWKGAGYFSIIFLAAIIGIDHEYYEAAKIDGASKWQQIWNITLPSIVPVIVMMCLIAVGRIFYSDFGLFYQVPLDAGPLQPTTNVIDTYVYRSFLAIGDIGMSSAAGAYQSVVGFILVLSTNYIIRKVNRDNAMF
ncbi:ABC transporter permease [Paenibacillus aestuarii]|uniref:ABC transporter permease n=1 Tax=Paenibacillus aestuarii TaxID=516965 RepID=A0ABW0K919_9BACL|nr:ABC transporter permease subunit [Paenibacillus aestuarii]